MKKQYIDKADIVTELRRRKQVAFGWMETAPNNAIEAEFELCDDILSFINNLEIKEVDLSRDFEKEIDFEKELKSWIDDNTYNGYCSASIHDTAEHFFELALNAIHKQKAQQIPTKKL